LFSKSGIAPPSHFAAVYNILDPGATEENVRMALAKTYNLNDVVVDIWCKDFREWCDRRRIWRKRPWNLDLLLEQNWEERSTVDDHRDNLEKGSYDDFAHMQGEVETYLDIESPVRTINFQNVTRPNKAPSTDSKETFVYFNEQLENPAELEESKPTLLNSTLSMHHLPLEVGNHSTHPTRARPPVRTQMVYLGRIEGAKSHTDDEPVPLPYYAVAKLSNNGGGTIEGIFAMPVDLWNVVSTISDGTTTT
jgi:hypothetical protein